MPTQSHPHAARHRSALLHAGPHHAGRPGAAAAILAVILSAVIAMPWPGAWADDAEPASQPESATSEAPANDESPWYNQIQPDQRGFLRIDGFQLISLSKPLLYMKTVNWFLLPWFPAVYVVGGPGLVSSRYTRNM